MLLVPERHAEPSLPAPVMIWNPPWTLSLTALPSQFPYALGPVLWMLVSSLILAGLCFCLRNDWGVQPKGVVHWRMEGDVGSTTQTDV
jgi:hypothetical protein